MSELNLSLDGKVALRQPRRLFQARANIHDSTPPTMIVMMLMTTNRKITGGLRLGTSQKILGWLATAAMVCCRSRYDRYVRILRRPRSCGTFGLP